MGLQFNLTDTFTGSGAQVLYPDKIMGAGSLMLMDFGHSQGGFTGVPGAGSQIPNVAWRTANGLVSGVPGQAALSMGISTSPDAATLPFAERTPKKGFHQVVSQANDAASKFLALSLPASLLAYVIANPLHAYYFSVWFELTRGMAAGGTYGLGYILGGGGIYEYIMVPSGGGFTTNTSLGQTVTPGVNNVGTPSRMACAPTSNGGSASGLTTAFPLVWGNGGPYASLTHHAPSIIAYRYYMEDMTVSAAAGGYARGAAITTAQRYTELDAADAAAYTAAFGTGGRFNGDTYTSPSGYP